VSDDYTERLAEHLDANGDLAPPWAEFPSYERYTIGWRMGYGEDWLGYLHVFLDRLGPKRETREAWLRRHPPAPYTWANWIAQLFGLTDDSTIDEDVFAEFAAAGLIAPDAAYARGTAFSPATSTARASLSASSRASSRASTPSRTTWATPTPTGCG
jgi:hypothetical protein